MPALLLAVAESSKTAWYIGGSVLAIYAVVLSGIGMARPSFPFGTAGARGVMLLSVVLAAAAVATAIVTA
jgi:hypothetical protein